MQDDDLTFDVAIIGGGPAGLTAAVWLGRYLHRVVVIDSGDPRNWETRGVNGFPGHPGIKPAELRGRTRDECRELGVTLVDGFVAKIRPVPGPDAASDGKSRDRKRASTAASNGRLHGYDGHDDGATTGEKSDEFIVEYDPMPATKAREDQRGPGAPRVPSDNARRPETRALRARRILLAFGLKDEWPKIPGLRQVYGSAAHVCPDCDGYDTRGKKIVVIAAGRKAVGMALNLTTWTRDIVICTDGRPPDLEDEYCAKLDALNIPVLSAKIERVVPEGDHINAIELEGGMHLDCDHIFFALSQRPADDLGAQLDCERDEDGHIVVDDHQKTSVMNVWAAGDIDPGPQLAIVGAAEGAVAALSIHKSLVPPERKLEREPVETKTAERRPGERGGARPGGRATSAA